MKYSTNKISRAKRKNTASKALCFKLGSKDLSISECFTHIFICYQIFTTPMFIHALLSKSTKNRRTEIKRDGTQGYNTADWF